MVGLAFGDEGKGAAIDFFSRLFPQATVCRFNGGPQAAHHVLTPGGREHVFAQLGSGLFVPGVKSMSLETVYCEPLAALHEYRILEDKGVPLSGRLRFDEQCPVVTPYHKALGQLRELARRNRHGSCGLGVGELWQDERGGLPVIRLADLKTTGRRELLIRIRSLLGEKARTIGRVDHPRAREALDLFCDEQAFDYYFNKIDEFLQTAECAPVHVEPPVLFEGAQGALLDARHGFFPYVSVTDATQSNKLPAYRIGLIRAIWTRHGPGPFPGEDERIVLPEDRCNRTNFWQGPVRRGWLDLVLLHYALSFVQVDALGLTCIDHAQGQNYFLVRAYRFYSPATDAGEFFELDEKGEAIRIRRLPGTIAEQQRLTELLELCRPVLENHPAPVFDEGTGDSSGLADYLQKETGKPVVYFSAGPTALQKTWAGPVRWRPAAVPSRLTFTLHPGDNP